MVDRAGTRPVAADQPVRSHLFTGAIVLSPDQTGPADRHVTIGRWLRPGDHYEPAKFFWQSAEREAVEETAVTGPALHPWHKGQDRPFVIDSHETPDKPSRNEPPHVYHDLQYLFIADQATPQVQQAEEIMPRNGLLLQNWQAFRIRLPTGYSLFADSRA